MQVSHETIYRSLFIQTRGLFKNELRKHLRTGRKFRHSRKHQSGYRQRIIDGVPISERPACVEDRAVPGHWEGDLICGAGNSDIATVVERQTRFTVLVKVDGKETRSVIGALTRHMGKLPSLLQQSLTWDRGTEMMGHRAFSMPTRMAVTLRAHGNAVPTRIPTGFSGSTFQKAADYRVILKMIWISMQRN